MPRDGKVRFDGSMMPMTSPPWRTVNLADQLAIVRPLPRAPCRRRSDRSRRATPSAPGFSATMRSVAPGRRADDAEQRHAEAEMRDRRAPGRARQAGGARASAVASGTRSRPVRSTRSVSAPAMTKSGKPDAERRQHRAAACTAKVAAIADNARAPKAADQPLRHAEQIAALPGQQRPERHRQQQRHEQRRRRSD